MSGPTGTSWPYALYCFRTVVPACHLWCVIHDAETWRESVRGFVQTAWEALDRAEIVLNQAYADTHDEHVGRFKRKFARAAAALIDLAVDEVYPPD